jgi:hypothetical protein
MRLVGCSVSSFPPPSDHQVAVQIVIQIDEW